MAKKSSEQMKVGTRNGRVAQKTPRFNDAEFIQFELDKTAQQACKTWQSDLNVLFDAVQNLADLGYVLSTKFDTFSDSYAAFLRQSENDGPNSGFILTGRGSTPAKAIKQLLYKHFEVMSEDWSEFGGASRKAELDD